MDFFSIEFLVFIGITIVIYYLVYLLNKVSKRIIIPQWIVLLIASLIFYGFTNYVYLIYLGASSIISYSVAIFCQYKFFERTDNRRELEYEFQPHGMPNHTDRRIYENIITAIAIVANVGILAVLKYYNFFVTTVNSVFHFGIAVRNFIVPLGISFYTFSLIAYNVDCCKRVTAAEKNPFKFLLFVSYFPKVLQGPISSYDRLKEDGLFKEHDFKDNNYLKSLFRISIGLIKKIVIANVLNLYVNASYANLDGLFGGSLILASLLYTIQLYCDFSGFLDITIGISNLFGINLEENFNIPYISSSIQEFWRRWHITLGNWLKKYLYIPLGGNRVPIWRWIINTLIVWLVSGLWHGANWTFIVWGLFNGVLLIINGLPKIMRKKKGINDSDKQTNKLIKCLGIVLTFALVNFAWIFFRSDNISQAGKFILHMIEVWKPNSYNMFSDANIAKANWLFGLSFVFVSLLIVIRILMNYRERILSKFGNQELVTLIYRFSLTVIFFSMSIFTFIYLKSVSGGESSFIYFEF